MNPAGKPQSVLVVAAHPDDEALGCGGSLARLAKAGAEVRERFTVSDLVIDDDRVTGIRGHTKSGPTVTEQARVIIGADGLRSVVARAVRPEQYHEKPQLLAGYYTYWSGLPMEGRFETWVRPDRGFAA